MMPKKVLTIVLIALGLWSCKNDKDTVTNDKPQEEKVLVAEPGKTLKQSDGLIAIHGQFLYVEKDNAAVLQTPTQMYSVVLNEEIKALRAQVEPFKTDEYTMVPITVRGRIFEKDPTEQGWDLKIEIKEILKVSAPEPEDNDIIKLGNK